MMITRTWRFVTGVCEWILNAKTESDHALDRCAWTCRNKCEDGYRYTGHWKLCGWCGPCSWRSAASYLHEVLLAQSYCDRMQGGCSFLASSFRLFSVIVVCKTRVQATTHIQVRVLSGYGNNDNMGMVAHHNNFCTIALLLPWAFWAL